MCEKSLSDFEFVLGEMMKSNADRQKLYRKNLLKDNVKFEQLKGKARVRENTRRQNLTGGSLEQLRLRQKQAFKKHRERKNGSND